MLLNSLMVKEKMNLKLFLMENENKAFENVRHAPAVVLTRKFILLNAYI